MSSSIVKSLRTILLQSNKVSGTVVAVASSGMATVRTSKGLVNALPPANVQVVVGSPVIVDGGNIYFGVDGKKQPKVFRV